jgi:hypothetical protein
LFVNVYLCNSLSDIQCNAANSNPFLRLCVDNNVLSSSLQLLHLWQDLVARQLRPLVHASGLCYIRLHNCYHGLFCYLCALDSSIKLASALLQWPPRINLIIQITPIALRDHFGRCGSRWRGHLVARGAAPMRLFCPLTPELTQRGGSGV